MYWRLDTTKPYSEDNKKHESGCGWRVYQSPTPDENKCPKCGKNVERELVFKAKESPRSTSFLFDKTLHFQYFNEFKKRPEGKGDCTETMSLQGSFFMLTREKYWELNICDEEFGSWGQQGVEVACKTWFSGGGVFCDQTTWYAHMFRTQGGDFSFPYKQSGKQIDHARKFSRELFLENKWPKAIYKLDWLLNKFSPVPYWDYDIKNGKSTNKKPSKGIVYYTDNEINESMASMVRDRIKKGMKEKHIVSVSLLKPIDFGKNIYMDLPRGYLTMAKQILKGLEESTAEVIFFCEHDVMYHPSHFDFVPPDRNVVYYNTNVWRVRADGHALYTDDLKQLSGLVAYRDVLIKHYKKRVEMLEKADQECKEKDKMVGDYPAMFGSYVRAMGFEPGTHGRPERVDDLKSDSYKSKYPNIDIRHDKNLTPSRWSKDQFRNERYTRGWKEAKIPSTTPLEEASEFLSSI